VEDKNIYKYKDRNYLLLQEAEMKLPNGEWVPCVIYRQYENAKTYVRESLDFMRKFELV